MTEIAELEAQVKTAFEDLRRNYKKAVSTVVSLRKKINDLELSISRKSSARTYADVERLNSAIERLDEFIDSVILESAGAREKYERLKRECRTQAFEPAELKDLLTLCEKNEQLAKDLLCYSLGHFKTTNHT